MKSEVFELYKRLKVVSLPTIANTLYTHLGHVNYETLKCHLTMPDIRIFYKRIFVL